MKYPYPKSYCIPEIISLIWLKVVVLNAASFYVKYETVPYKAKNS